MANTSSLAVHAGRKYMSAIPLICVSTLLCISVWFSASFIINGIAEQWEVSDAELAWVTFGVQIGFILGAVASALLRLPDRMSARKLFTCSAAGAGAANLFLLVFSSFGEALALRLATGVFLAGIYPVAVREILTWVRPRRRGLASSTLLAALTIGSAAPHLINVFGQSDWRVVIIATSILSVSGGLLFLLVPKSGPYRDARSNASLRQGLAALRDRRVLLVNLAYCGHMWELYAMWAFVGTLISHRLSADAVPPEIIAMDSFLVIALGAVGCISGGIMGDRFGKVAVAQAFAVISGIIGAALAVSGMWGPAMLLVLCALWGITVIGDSALLSALLREYCPEAHVGSALSIQMAGGYTVSAGSILLLPVLAAVSSWELAFLALVLGPVVEIVILQVLKSKAPAENHTDPQRADTLPLCP